MLPLVITSVQGYRTNLFNRQRGIVLIATLLMLCVLIILVLSLAGVPIGDLKVTSNNSDQMLAKQAANASLEEAKKWILQTWANTVALPVLSCSYPTTLRLQNTTFNINGYANNPLSWWQTSGCAAQTSPSGATQKPYYVIKYLGCDNANSVDLYQIVVRGTGVSANSVAYSEAIVTFPTTGNLTGVSATTAGATLVTATRPGATYSYQAPTFYGSWQGWMQRSSSIGFFQGGWGWGSINWQGYCALGLGVWSECMRNCAGYLRVAGMSGGDNPPCQLKVGPWVGPGTGVTSSIQLPDGVGNMWTFSCSQ